MPELLQGALGAVSFSGLLQLVELEGLTCWLRLGEGSLVGFVDGVPVYARSASLSGRQAILRLFFASAGTTFRLDQDLRPHGEPLGQVFDLVLEGCRLADLWDSLEDAVLGEAPGTVHLHLKGAAAPLVPWLDGRRTLGVAVEVAGVEPSCVVDQVAGLVEKGALEVVAKAPEAALDEDAISLSQLLPGRRERHPILDEDTIPPDLTASVSPEDAPSAPALLTLAEWSTPPADASSRGTLDALDPELFEALPTDEEEPFPVGDADEELLALEAEDDPFAALEADDTAEESVAMAVRLSFGGEEPAEEATDVKEAATMGKGRRAFRGTLSELSMRQVDRRDAQSRSFLAWAMKRADRDTPGSS